MSEEMKTNEETVLQDETEMNTAQEETVLEESPVVEENPLEKELLSLKQENEELNQQVNTLKNEYAKAYADAENMKKRLEKDFEKQTRYRIQDFALEILPVIDNCERALKVETEDETYKKGVEMIFNSLKKALAKEGVEEVECINQPYDANWMQAMMMEHVEGVEPGVVIEVLQKGYKLKDRILRAAMVKVSE